MSIGLTVLMVALVLTYPYILDHIKNKNKRILMSKYSLLAFIALVLLLTLGIRDLGEEISANFKLFQCYRGLLNQLSYKWRTYGLNYNEEQFRIISTGICNIIVNVALFIPLGYLLPEAFPQKKYRWWKMLLSGVAFSLIIEILQLVAHRGCFDLDDLFHNSIGVLSGYILWKQAIQSQKQA